MKQAAGWATHEAEKKDGLHMTQTTGWATHEAGSRMGYT